MAPILLVSFSLLLLLLAPRSLASLGDRSPDFANCIESCTQTNCSAGPGGREGQGLALALRALRWTCSENCEYECMHEVTRDDLRLGRDVRQFHGKWPFVRVLGIQEPASVVFSILNGATTLLGYHWLASSVPPDSAFLWVLRAQVVVNMNTWVWSTVFHSRDTAWTEKLDYFSAAAFIVCGLIVQFLRIVGPERMWLSVLYAVVWLGLYAGHVYYLTFVEFNYGYNMTASVVAGAIYSVIWCVWCALHWWRGYVYVWKCAAAVLATNIFVLLELLDFPPIWWTFDAHSLWHLSTVPLPFLYFSFWKDDALFHLQLKKIV